MAKSTSENGKRYPREFKQQLVELVRAGRSVAAVASEFGCSGFSIRRWMKLADRNAARGDSELTVSERAELARLRQENRQLKIERDILAKATAWFAQETAQNTKRSSDS
jgi:transposase